VSGEMEKIRNTSNGVAVDLKTIQKSASNLTARLEFSTELLIVLVQFQKLQNGKNKLKNSQLLGTFENRFK
jgi:hypothetical protein